MHFTLWQEPLYRETFYLVVGALTIMALALFPFRNRNTHTQANWASIKSWWFTAPILLIFCGFSAPWPLVILTMVAMVGATVVTLRVMSIHRQLAQATTGIAASKA